MTEIEGLIERLEKATGADRELDAAIWVAMTEGARLTKNSFGGTLVEQHGVAWRLDEAVHHFTASLDAALALVERVRPGWEWHVLFAPSHGDDGCSYAGVTNGASTGSVALEGKRPAIALCLALLRTLETSNV